MNGHGSKFGRIKEQALAALLSHRNVEESAKAAGISTATLKRWLQLPEFKAAYLAARREVVLQTNARMQANSGAAELKAGCGQDCPPSNLVFITIRGPQAHPDRRGRLPHKKVNSVAASGFPANADRYRPSYPKRPARRRRGKRPEPVSGPPRRIA